MSFEKIDSLNSLLKKRVTIFKTSHVYRIRTYLMFFSKVGWAKCKRMLAPCKSSLLDLHIFSDHEWSVCDFGGRLFIPYVECSALCLSWGPGLHFIES